jgi:hypothetical protein
LLSRAETRIPRPAALPLGSLDEARTLDFLRDALLNTQRGAYTAIAIVGLVIALLLGVSFSFAALIGIVCGIIAQQIADERWLSERGTDAYPDEPLDRNEPL